MKKVFGVLLVGVVIAVFSSTNCCALDLSQRFGIGYTTGESNVVMGRYWISRTFAIDGLLGFSLAEGSNVLTVGTQAWYKLIGEKNLNFTVGGRISLETIDYLANVPMDDDLAIGPLVGIEYFFPGIENLGLQANLGLAFHSRSNRFNTVVSQIGLLYYFK